MKIPLLIAFVFIVGFLNANAQDIIVKKSGETIKTKIIEVSATEIKYKNFNNLNGPVYIAPIADLKGINYENGTKSDFSNEASFNPNASTIQDAFVKGQADAGIYYNGYKAAGTGTLVVSLLSPLVGLIPAVACSVTPPQKQNLEYPNSSLFENNKDYQNGYMIRAKKKKANKVWTNWGIALAVNIVVVLALVK